MQLILFSKMVRDLGVEALIAALKAIGADGVDLCVRPGYPVSPENARKSLPRAARAIRDASLAIPMISAPTDLTDPGDASAEPIFAACHDANVAHVKIGYWKCAPGDYWKQVDSARRDLEGWERLGTRFGVKTLLHTHSGANLALNACSLMDLARSFNPSHVGAYLDPGHLSLCGEPPAMAMDVVGAYLSLVAIKDPRWERSGPGKPYRTHFGPVGEGIVDWAGVAKALKARAYGGALSFHSEYEGLSSDLILAQTRRDMTYIRGLVVGTAGAAV